MKIKGQLKRCDRKAAFEACKIIKDTHEFSSPIRGLKILKIQISRTLTLISTKKNSTFTREILLIKGNQDYLLQKSLTPAKSIISPENRKKRALPATICIVAVTRHVWIDGNERFRVWLGFRVQGLEFDYYMCKYLHQTGIHNYHRKENGLNPEVTYLD